MKLLKTRPSKNFRPVFFCVFLWDVMDNATTLAMMAGEGIGAALRAPEVDQLWITCGMVQGRALKILG